MIAIPTKDKACDTLRCVRYQVTGAWRGWAGYASGRVLPFGVGGFLDGLVGWGGFEWFGHLKRCERFKRLVSS